MEAVIVLNHTQFKIPNIQFITSIKRTNLSQSYISHLVSIFYPLFLCSSECQMERIRSLHDEQLHILKGPFRASGLDFFSFHFLSYSTEDGVNLYFFIDMYVKQNEIYICRHFTYLCVKCLIINILK